MRLAVVHVLVPRSPRAARSGIQGMGPGIAGEKAQAVGKPPLQTRLKRVVIRTFPEIKGENFTPTRIRNALLNGRWIERVRQEGLIQWHSLCQVSALTPDVSDLEKVGVVKSVLQVHIPLLHVGGPVAWITEKGARVPRLSWEMLGKASRSSSSLGELSDPLIVCVMTSGGKFIFPCSSLPCVISEKMPYPPLRTVLAARL